MSLEWGRTPSRLALTRYRQYFIAIKGVAGENILRNIVGNKWGLGGGYCTIVCNNAPFSVSRTIFFQTQTPRPIQNPTPTQKQKKLKTPPKNTSKLGGGCNNWQYCAIYCTIKGVFAKNIIVQ